MGDGVASKLRHSNWLRSATGKVESRWLSFFVAAMGAMAIFAPARRLLHYALNLIYRKPLAIDAGQREQGHI
jgi:hypothetical protein